MPKRSGRKSAAQTPAPAKERIFGSKKNPKGTAASESSAKSIKLSPSVMSSLKRKLDEFKEKYPRKSNITLNDLKAVYRRGAGAYSSSHRPFITGGAPNTRNAWAMARVNKFLKKAAGQQVKAAYVQDDDLMADGGEVMAKGGQYNDKELLEKYKSGKNIGFTAIAHLKAKGLIPRSDGTKRKSEKYLKDGGKLDEEHKETAQKWGKLVNMSKSELQRFYDSEEGKKAGLSVSEAKEQGISRGRDSARMILKMKDTPKSEWTPDMWRWAGKQISFINRMSGNKGPLYKDGEKTRKHTSLLIWGHNPNKKEAGGTTDSKTNTYMNDFEFNQMPSVTEIVPGKKLLLRDEIFESKNAQSAPRYVLAEILKKSRMVGYFELKVIDTDGLGNPAADVIVRSIKNILNRGRAISDEVDSAINEYRKGGHTKGYFGTISGKTGGELKGPRHKDGGIPGTNNATGQHLEVEGGEVIITRDAVSDPTKREFQGEQLTNKEILSKINESGGGVSFAEGGETATCKCNGNMYMYGGKSMKASDIFMAMGGKVV